METGSKKRLPNPKEGANFLSKLFFIWVYKIIYSGDKTNLENYEIPQPMTDDLSENLGNRLESRWLEAVSEAWPKGTKPSLLKTIVKEFGLQYLCYGIIYFCNDILSILVRPVLVGNLVSYFIPSSDMTRESAFLFAFLLGFTFFMNSILGEHYNLSMQQLGLKVRVACISMVYRKCLRLSHGALSKTSPGQIINIISNDVARFEIVAFFINPMWSGPLVSCVLFYVLCTNVGVPGVVGFCVFLLMLPIQVLNGKLTSVFRLQMAKKTDERVKLMCEIISGIQVIKLYAWEKPFQAILSAARRSELRAFRKGAYMRGIHMILSLFTTRFALFCTLLTIVLTGGKLTVEMVFIILAYFTSLSFSLAGALLRGFAEIAEILVSIKRIETFLLQDERGYETDYSILGKGQLFKNQKYRDKVTPLIKGNEKYKKNGEDGVLNVAFQDEDKQPSNIYSIEMNNVAASWTSNNVLTLKNLNLKIKSGQLVGVVGAVGSGKSSLLQMLLGELQTCQGHLNIGSSVSFASQEPWIFAGTVRQNIVFVQEFDRRRYNKVTKVCCLERDFELLPRGDMTLVGERGASLSGGQKARINLARAVYKKADIYLLDDPLSAVDAQVGKQLFHDCIEVYLRDKTRVLVTHQVQHLSQADHLVLLSNNEIEMQGSFWEFQRSGFNCVTMTSPEESVKEVSESNVKLRQFSRSISRMSNMSYASSFGIDDSVYGEEFESTEREQELTTNMPTKELYLGYIKSGINQFGALIIALMFFLTQLLVSVCDFWVSYWTATEQTRQPNDVETWPTTTFAIVHGVLVCSVFLVGMIRNVCFFESTLRCSEVLHKKMVKSVVGTHLSFFSNNPSGRILNRFTTDMGGLDEMLPKSIMDVGQTLCQILGALVVAAYVNPWFLIPIFVVIAINLHIRQKFVQNSKNLKKIEGIARSPVYSHFNTTLQGLTTLRANQAETQLLKEFNNHQDHHTGTLFLFYSSTTAFSFALNAFFSCFMATIVFSFLFFQDDSYGSNVGLTITQIMSLSLYMQWVIRMSTEIIHQMTSCERILEYTKFELEEQNPESKQAASEGWPTHGEIDLQHVYARYNPQEPYVIRDLSLTILPKEKVGIVGRTGAGKSSLIGALFRLMEVEGVITIDGVDTSTLTLEELRLKISIIPQDPILFSGTLRRNLDPFGQFPDDQLWAALDEAGVKDFTRDMAGFSLDMKVMEGGSNFSIGQRQLICLARAILRNNKILVLDEATANVDPQTDALIQKTIKSKFADQTVLTIAHRLNTIMDSDRVLVMDAGKFVEFDHPYKLLSDPEGYFFQLVKQTGKSMTAHLIQMAKDSYYTSSCSS